MTGRPEQEGAARRIDPSRRPVLYVVATAHLDSQWRWTIQDTIRDFLPDTLERNFERFEKYPGYVLSFEGAFRYMLIREYYPALFERLKRLVRAGRWRVAGSMLDAADVNLVSPESLIRHVLYANRFFAAELGVTSRDLFLPDCFGFGHSLPSIAAHCGLVGFSSQKFIKWMRPARIPFNIGLWEGPDGSRVVAALNPEGYGDGLFEDLSRAERWRERIERLGEETGVYVGYKYFGVGDQGGAPDEATLEWLEKSLAGDGPLAVVHAGSDQIFRDLGPELAARLPRFRGELLLPRHGTGCYTSQAVMKRWNRRNELLADAAERAAAAAAWLGAMPYPRERLRQAWIRFLWHQMHDDLTGTSIPEAYLISWNDEVVALNEFATVLEDGVAALARGLDTRVEGAALAVFNPLSIEREDVVEVELDGEIATAAGLADGVRVFGPDGREAPAQLLGGGERPRVAFLARLPPVGLAVFDLRAGDGPCRLETGLEAAPDRLEGERLRVALDERGDVASVFDKRLGRELLAAPARLELFRDRSAKWPAWEILLEDLEAGPAEVVGGPAAIRVVERGPARAAIEVRRRIAGSTFVQLLRLAAGDAGERLEVHCRVDWRSRGRLLKAAFPLAAASPRATYDLGLGAIARGNNRPESYEVPAQQWADVTATDGGLGVAVLTESKYGWDKPDDRTLRLSLLRSPRTFRRFPHQAVQDLGPHRFAYAIHGHDGDGRADVVWHAARLNQPPFAFRAAPGAGPLGRSFSFLRLDDRRVAARAVKAAEEGDDLVVRLQEVAGETAAVRLGLAAPIERAREIDGAEEPLGPANLDGGDLVAELTPFRPRAFALAPAPPAAKLAPPRALPVELPLDLVAASFHGEARGPDFDGAGRSLPGELLPAAIDCGGVELRLAAPAPGAPSCLACRGQSLALPAAGPGRLVLVATAVGGAARASFGIGDAEAELTVADWGEPLGRWVRRRDLRGLPWGRAEPPRVRREKIAWLGTHRHDRRVRDEPYAFCYLFRYELEVPAGAAALRLPDEPRIRFFAMTLVGDGFGAARSAGWVRDWIS